MIEKYDVVIVGASLAGSAAAICLGRAGYRVALVDKESFPRRKPCGEGLSTFGLKQLDKLQLKDTILQLPHLEYEGYDLRTDHTGSVLKSPWGQAITIQRSLLDSAVLSAASRTPHVTTFLSRKVTSISSQLIECGNERITAQAIIVACGSSASVLKKICNQVQRTGPNRSGISVTFKGEFSKLPTLITILLKKDFEIYCTPLAGGRLNVSILAASDYPQNLRELLLSSEVVDEVFDKTSFRGVLELEPEGRTNIGNVRRSCSLSSVFLAGDAKEEFDPIGGMGMSHALCSGIATADQVVKSLQAVPQSKEDSALSFRHLQQSISAMRLFTNISYHTLKSAKRWPMLLHVAASPSAQFLLKSFTRQLA